jgi:hypothetical protein
VSFTLAWRVGEGIRPSVRPTGTWRCIIVCLVADATGQRNGLKTSVSNHPWRSFTELPRVPLTFKKRASYIQDGRTATLQMLHFIYFFNKYEYWVF